MADLLSIDGVSLRSEAYGCATRTGRYSMPPKRGENLILPGSSGSRFMKNKPYDEGLGALSVWATGADFGDVLTHTNLITDPSFEVGVGGFATSGAATAVTSTTRPRTGANSLRVTNTASGENSASKTLTGWLPNTVYTFSAFFWNASGNASDAYIRAGGTAVVSGPVLSSAGTMRDSWGKVSVTFLTAASGTLTLAVLGATGNAQLTYFDDLSVVAGYDPYNFSGASADSGAVRFDWTGAVNASTSTRTLVNQLTIPGSFQGQRQQFETNMNRMMRFFTRGHRLSTLRAAQPDGSVRTAQVEWKEWSEPEVQAGGTRAEWAIAYTIPDVWWEDEADTVQSATVGATLPKTLDLTSFTGMTGVIEDAVLAVPGPITNPRVTDAETGGWLQYTGTVPNGQTWTVDVAAATSTVAGVSVMANTTHTGGYKLFVIPNCFGTSDTPRLTLSGTTGGAATNLTVTARRKWVNG